MQQVVLDDLKTDFAFTTPDITDLQYAVSVIVSPTFTATYAGLT